MALRRKSPSLLLSAFFGLNLDTIAEERMSLFTQLHEICFWGQGGYDFETIYNLPIWLRNFIFSRMKKHYEKDSNSQETNIQKSIANLKAGAQHVPPPNQKVLYKTGTSKK